MHHIDMWNVAEVQRAIHMGISQIARLYLTKVFSGTAVLSRQTVKHLIRG